MTLDWNPNDGTGTAGLETFFTAPGSSLLAGGSAAAVTFTSTAAETIDLLYLYLSDVTDQPAVLTADVYETGDEVGGTVTTSVFRPNDDLQIGGSDSQGATWKTAAAGTTNLYAQVDESALNIADYVYYAGQQNQRKKWRWNAATAAWPADQRVVGGRVRAVTRRDKINGTLEVWYYDGTSEYYLGSITATTKQETQSVPWPDYCPSTGLPWTQAQIVALDSTAAVQFRTFGVSADKKMYVFQAWLELDWVAESRVAVGNVEVDSTVAGTYVAVPLIAPNTGADNWAKSDATDYTVLVRRSYALGSARWRHVSETADTAAVYGRAGAGEMAPTATYTPTMDARGLVSTMNDPIAGRTMAWYLYTTAPALSVDGSPYATLPGVVPYTGRGVAQKFTAGLTGSYTLLRCLIASGVTATPATGPAVDGTATGLADLTVKVKNASTHATLSTAVLTGAAWAEHPAVAVAPGTDAWQSTTPPTFRVVELAVPAAALNSGTQYYVEFTTAQANPTSAGSAFWAVLGAVAGGVGSYGGATDDAYYTNGAGVFGAAVSADLCLTLSVQPTALTGFSATGVPVATGNESDCGPAWWDRVALAANATGLGAGFARYEIDRRDPDGDWEQIRSVTDPSALAVDDVEARLGVTEAYRARQVRAGDLIPSAWTATDTAAVSVYGTEVKIASNHADGGVGDAVAYERGPDYEWEFPSETEVTPIYGRDGRYVFVAAEQQGDDFGVELVLFAGTDSTPTPTVEGRAVFDALAALLVTDVPHFAVCDADGRRWYGHAALVRATRTEADSIYVADVEVNETQSAPTPAET